MRSFIRRSRAYKGFSFRQVNIGREVYPSICSDQEISPITHSRDHHVHLTWSLTGSISCTSQYTFIHVGMQLAHLTQISGSLESAHRHCNSMHTEAHCFAIDVDVVFLLVTHTQETYKPDLAKKKRTNPATPIIQKLPLHTHPIP